MVIKEVKLIMTIETRSELAKRLWNDSTGKIPAFKKARAFTFGFRQENQTSILRM